MATEAVETLFTMKNFFSAITILIGVIVALVMFNVKKALKDIEDLKSKSLTANSLTFLKDKLNTMEKDLELLEDKALNSEALTPLKDGIRELKDQINHLEDKFVSMDKGRDLEYDVRKLRDELSRIDADMIKHTDMAIERLRADLSDRFKLIVDMVNKRSD